jgi:transposase-like protein
MSTRSDTRDRWRKIIHRQQVSGLSALAFCRRAGVSPASLYAWRRKLRGEVAFTEVELSPLTTVKPDGIELRLRGQRSIVVQPGFDRQTLIELLAVLEPGPDTMATREASA